MIYLNQFTKVMELLTGSGLKVVDNGDGTLSLSPQGMLTKSVAGNSNVVLSPTESSYNIIQLTGAITGDISVTFTAQEKPWIVYNHTTGAHTITCKCATGTGIVVASGDVAILFSDGSIMLRATADCVPTS